MIDSERIPAATPAYNAVKNLKMADRKLTGVEIACRAKYVDDRFSINLTSTMKFCPQVTVNTSRMDSGLDSPLALADLPDTSREISQEHPSARWPLETRE